MRPLLSSGKSDIKGSKKFLKRSELKLLSSIKKLLEKSFNCRRSTQIAKIRITVTQISIKNRIKALTNNKVESEDDTQIEYILKFEDNQREHEREQKTPSSQEIDLN